MSDTDWDNYRIYIIESIKTMKESLDKIEHELKLQNIDNIKVFHSYKEEFENKLKIINEDLIKANIKLGIIVASSVLLITALVNFLVKYLAT